MHYEPRITFSPYDMIQI